MSSPITDYSSDEEDKIGELIYKSSKTAKLLRAVNKENAEQLILDEELNRRKKERAEAEKEVTAMVKTEKERVKAQRALQWVKEASICPRLRKRLLLLMTLIRTNPRTPPSCYPSHGTVLSDGFHWAAYPPLDNLLRKNMMRYYELSTEHSQTKVQVEFNNIMVHLIRREAAKHGWKFDHKVFDDKKIRDRIRCFYKAHMQNAKKRLKTMLKNPEKKANIKDLAALYHLIEEKGQNTEAILETIQPAAKLNAKHNENTEKDLCVLITKMEAKLIQKKQLKVDEEIEQDESDPPKSQVSRKYRDKTEAIFDEKALVKANKEVTEEEVKAQHAVQLAKEASICPRLRKRILLLMALARTNPRSPPSCYPSHGTVLADGFPWAEYPPLDTILRKNMRRYYELSTERCQLREQQEYNNCLVHLIRNEAAKHGWKFDDEVFDDNKIRDRIRCFYKSHMQNAKKRLNTMLKNPEKKANIKELATLYHLIEEKGQNTRVILKTMLKIKERKNDTNIKATIKAKKEAELPKAVHKPKSHNKRLNSLLYAANELESLDKVQPKNKRAKFNPLTKEGDENISYMAAWANIADQFNISHHHIDRSL